MQNLLNLYQLSPFLLILTVIGLTVMLIFKMKKIEELNSYVAHLKRSLDEIDEQAKLILRTDIELNKIQEELDRKIIALYALQRISREISTTIDESEIFAHIKDSHIEDMGFEKALIFLWNEKKKKFTEVFNLGYNPQELESIIEDLDNDFYLKIMETNQTISSFSCSDEQLKEKIKNLFKVNSFVITPLLPKEGNRGFVFVGREAMDTMLTAGNEELIIIFANQLSQTLDNARLFEKT